MEAWQTQAAHAHGSPRRDCKGTASHSWVFGQEPLRKPPGADIEADGHPPALTPAPTGHWGQKFQMPWSC